MSHSLEKAASKAMGTVKGAKASLAGLTGVFKKLMQEHGEVSTLVKRVSMTSDESVRRELYPTIRKELLSHEKGELAEVYSVLSQYNETSAIARDHAEQAGELELAIKEIDALDMAGPDWASAFERLASLVKHHIADEEGKFFPTAQKTIGDLKARSLESRYEEAKRSAMSNLQER